LIDLPGGVLHCVSRDELVDRLTWWSSPLCK